MAPHYYIVLASESKRRSQILSSCGIKHAVLPSNIREIHPKKKHIVSSVMKNAERKVRSILRQVQEDKKNTIIIGADTLVTLGNEVIGKPGNPEEAKGILRKFSDSEIDVYTGLFVIDARTQKYTSGFEKTSVRVGAMNEKKINTFFGKFKSFDKAGGFSIEGIGSIIFDNIKGSYFNILGLPMIKMNTLFSDIGHTLLDFCS